MRRWVLALMLLGTAPAGAADILGTGWRLEVGPRLRPAGEVNGWTLLRDAEAPSQAEDYGLVMVRVQRAVAPEAGPRHLAATLRSLRPFRFGVLPEAVAARQAGLPATVLEGSARRAQTGAALVLRAVLIHAPDRSFLLVASAPKDAWSGLQEAVLAAMASFRPVGHLAGPRH